MNEGVPENVLAKWRTCKHDFEAVKCGAGAGIHVLMCPKCGYRERTDHVTWKAMVDTQDGELKW